MSFILYGGSEEVVKKQLKCNHEWEGPGIDEINRFYKCSKCFCIEYDCSWKVYLETIEYLKNKKD